MSLMEKITDKKIRKKVEASLLPENKDYIKETLAYLDKEIEFADSPVGEEISRLKEDVASFAHLTTLQFFYDDNKMFFYVTKPTKFELIYENGEFIIPAKTSGNGLYLNIISKNMELLNKIACEYAKVQPYLVQRTKLKMARDIVSGRTLYDAYLLEYKGNKNSKEQLKEIQKNMVYIKEKLFDKTGWYAISSTVFGKVDVDNNIENAITLKERWQPYSEEKDKQQVEMKYIYNNHKLLEDYREENKKIQKINKQQQDIENIINGQIEKRNKIINTVKSRKSSELVKQKAI